MTDLRRKVNELYDLINERGLYVNTNHDVFLGAKKDLRAGNANQYQFTLLKKGGKAYASPLLLAALTSLLNHGTMLVTGAYGIGKTTGVEFAGHFFTGVPLDDILAATIQGHPQQTEEKMVARYHTGALVKEGIEQVIPRKFLTCPVKIIDEINRLDPDKLSIILRLIDTGRAIYGDKLLTAERGPLFATANYVDSGTFVLPPPAVDRFDVAAIVTSPQPWDLERIYSRPDEKLNGGLQKLLEIPEASRLSPDDFTRVRQEITQVSIDDELKKYLNFVLATLRFSEAASNDVSRMTKGNAWATDSCEPLHFKDHAALFTKNELSVRTARAIQRYARALAWLTGENSVTEEHIKTIFPYATWHKLEPSSKALQEMTLQKIANDRVAFAQDILEKVDADWEQIKSEPRLDKYSVALQHVEDESNPKPEVVENAILDISQWDHPYASVLAKRLETAFNEKVMRA